VTIKKHVKAGGGVDFQMEGPELTRALVVHVERKKRGVGNSFDRDAQSKLEEAIGLAEAIDLDIVDTLVAPLVAPKPGTFIGTGKVAEIAKRVEDAEAELVVVNAQLSPVQQRNLETEWKAKVLDRTGLILEIFGRRATTKEGILQVELAHLHYQKSRLVRSWTHLERQRGGFGFLGGPGESQLETDRRLIQERITKIEGELETVVKTRDLHRRGRERIPYPIVALVGYTNAGKSTLFNKLTDANVLAKDLLFATLDPTMRNIALPSGRKIILSDTVGFISELPTTLIASFRATLEEVLAADVILHVRDVSHHETEAQSHDVSLVLEELGIDEQRRGQIIEVWNKSDLLTPQELVNHQAQALRRPDVALVSSLTGDGIDQLLDKVEQRLGQSSTMYDIMIDPSDGKGLAWLHQRGEVLDRKVYEDGRTKLSVRLDADTAGQAQAKFGKDMKVKT
jgi:GTP-binding protein HflX